MLPPNLFLDTAFALALANPHDTLHDRAARLANQIEHETIRLITTQAVLIEIGNALAKQRYRMASIHLLTSLAHDPMVDVVVLTERLYQQAFHLYCQRPDKEWGMTDCVSFIVMESRGLTDALTYDIHFQQAGYRALLRDDAI